MSINFSTLQGLTIPEGVVTQITDASGNVLWALQNNKPIVLEVAKITSDTYAAETTYTGEQFILLNIYPKTNGTVSVTYGGLTKTITDTSGATSPNSQQVFFGTFNGVSDSVTTPASGTLTIEGDCAAFGCSQYVKDSKNIIPGYGSCITAVTNWGAVETIPDYAFHRCDGLVSITVPGSVGSIGGQALALCLNLESVIISEGVRSIGDSCCYSSGYPADSTSPKLTDVVLPSTIETIGYTPFCGNITDGNGNTTDVICYLSNLTVLATTPPTLSADAYGRTLGTLSHFNTKIIVPKGCGAAYKAAEGWSNYADKIVEVS